ncbi:MAG TPA: ABC transporter permease [Candidatus Dormibacteraeota bacterium]|nr:ABC transporter permease [Candidatus Dormibacteraeota bacterium]
MGNIGVPPSVVVVEARPAPSVARRRRRARNARWLWALRPLSVVLVLVAWELYGRHTNPILFTYPTAIAQAGVALAVHGDLTRPTVQSMSVLGWGLGLSIVVGVALGLAMGRSRVIEGLLDTPFNALYATPLVALVPVIVLWVGFGPNAKVLVVFLFAVFAILFSTARGVREVDSQLIEVARSYLATEVGLWKDVVLPSALPYIVTGIRLAVGRALVGVIIAEFYTSIGGFGYLIVTYANTFQTAKVFVPVVILMSLGVGLTAALELVERQLAPWKRKEEQRT